MASKGQQQDAIALLKEDHRNVEELFKEIEQLPEKQKTKRKRLVKKAIDELSLHADVEEQIFYPAVQDAAKEQDLVLEAVEEHELAKTLMQQLQRMESDDEHLKPKAMVLIKTVRAHVKEEESQMFPKIKGALTRDQLKELGQRIEEGKKAIRNPKDYLRLG